VYITLDGIAAVVDEKDDRLQIMSHHNRQFLDSQQPNERHVSDSPFPHFKREPDSHASITYE
jgi:hypothetical protein